MDGLGVMNLSTRLVVGGQRLVATATPSLCLSVGVAAEILGRGDWACFKYRGWTQTC